MDVLVDAALGADPARLDHDGRLDLLIEIERTRAALDAQAQQTLALLSREGDAEMRTKEWVREEVAAALRIAPATAASRLHDALDLVNRLPRTLDRLVDGSISLSHARALIDKIRPLDDETTAAVETRVLRRAGEQTVGQFRQSVNRAVMAADPRRADDKHRASFADRHVRVSPDSDGMAWFSVFLRSDDANALYTTVDGYASTLGDERTIDQKRADVLADLADLAASGPATRRHGRRPSVQVTVALSTLLGIDDQPGELDGHGPVPAGLARAIAADPSGTWRRLVTDHTGRLLDYGRTTYRPPADLRDFLLAEHATCTFPGCRRTSRRNEIDHVHPFGAGGTTSQLNGHPPCSRHHHVKHEAGWQVGKAGDGVVTWTSPSGRSYETPPTEHPIDTTRTSAGMPPPTRSLDPDPPPF